MSVSVLHKSIKFNSLNVSLLMEIVRAFSVITGAVSKSHSLYCEYPLRGCQRYLMSGWWTTYCTLFNIQLDLIMIKLFKRTFTYEIICNFFEKLFNDTLSGLYWICLIFVSCCLKVNSLSVIIALWRKKAT